MVERITKTERVELTKASVEKALYRVEIIQRAYAATGIIGALGVFPAGVALLMAGAKGDDVSLSVSGDASTTGDRHGEADVVKAGDGHDAP